MDSDRQCNHQKLNKFTEQGYYFHEWYPFSVVFRSHISEAWHMVCVGIYSVLVQSIATDGNISGAIWACMGYTVLLCFALFKTGSLSKSLFGAH